MNGRHSIAMESRQKSHAVQSPHCKAICTAQCMRCCCRFRTNTAFAIFYLLSDQKISTHRQHFMGNAIIELCLSLPHCVCVCLVVSVHVKESLNLNIDGPIYPKGVASLRSRPCFCPAHGVKKRERKKEKATSTLLPFSNVADISIEACLYRRRRTLHIYIHTRSGRNFFLFLTFTYFPTTSMNFPTKKTLPNCTARSCHY